MFGNTNNRKKTFLATAAILTVAMAAGNSFADDGGRNRGKQRSRNHASHRDAGNRHQGKQRPQRSNRSQRRDRDRGLIDLFFSFGNQTRRGHGSYGYESSNHRHGGTCRGGHYTQVWVAPVYHTHYDECGNARKHLVKNGYYKQVWQPRVCTIRGHNHTRHNTGGITIGAHYRR